MATTLVNLADYQIGDGASDVYRFPNGHTASVHRYGNKFLIDCEALDGDTVVPLTADAVERVLVDIYNLRAN